MHANPESHLTLKVARSELIQYLNCLCIQSYCAVWTTQRWSDRFHFFENDRFVLKRRKNKWQRPFVNDLLKEKIHLYGQNYFGQNVFRLFLSLKTTNIYKTTFITCSVSARKKIKSIFIKLRFISEILFKMIFVLKTIVFHKKNRSPFKKIYFSFQKR